MCSLTNYGRMVSIKLGSSGRKDIEIIRRVFIKWYPLYILLTYIKQCGSLTVLDIVRDLGGEMKKWTSLLYDLGIKIMHKRGVEKPFNKFVVANFFLPLAEQLYLIDVSDNKISLTCDGELFLNEMSLIHEARDYDVITTAPGDYTIYSAIADVLYACNSEVYIISPWINSSLVRIIENIVRFNDKLNTVYLITRNEKLNRNTICELHDKISNIDIKAYTYRSLHAKAIVNLDISKQSVVSSANLRKTSLYRNYELGIYFIKTPGEVINFVEQLMKVSTRIA